MNETRNVPAHTDSISTSNPSAATALGTHEVVRKHFGGGLLRGEDIATLLRSFTMSQLLGEVEDILAYPEVHVSVLHRMELGFINREIARRDAIRGK
jgi:hypothetical protein